MDAIDTYRELAGGLMDVYLSSVGNRQNEVMKVLTIMASIFIPLTFMAGIYGMNFDNMPELQRSGKDLRASTCSPRSRWLSRSQ
jgi:magnesium transporter